MLCLGRKRRNTDVRLRAKAPYAQRGHAALGGYVVSSNILCHCAGIA